MITTFAPLPHVLFIMWLWHFIHWEVEYLSPPLDSGQVPLQCKKGQVISEARPCKVLYSLCLFVLGLSHHNVRNLKWRVTSKVQEERSVAPAVSLSQLQLTANWCSPISPTQAISADSMAQRWATLANPYLQGQLQLTGMAAK